MGRVHGGVRRTIQSGAQGEETGEERLFEVTLLFCPGKGGKDGGPGKARNGCSFLNDAMIFFF